MPSPDPASSKPHNPGKGFLGWLGRQVGHVSKALKSDVTGQSPKTIYREKSVEEKTLPHDPNVKLRRTVIDEVVVEPAKKITGASPRATNDRGPIS